MVSTPSIDRQILCFKAKTELTSWIVHVGQTHSWSFLARSLLFERSRTFFRLERTLLAFDKDTHLVLED